MVNAPSVLYIAPAMTRLPPSVTVTKASTGLSKTPPPWLVQVSRVLFKNWTFSDSGDILSFCLHVFNLFQSAVPYFPHPSALFFISNMIQLKLYLCLHNFLPPYLKFETKKQTCFDVPHSCSWKILTVVFMKLTGMKHLRMLTTHRHTLNFKSHFALPN